MTHLDGNVLAGALSELIDTDLTAALGQCSGCLDTAALGEALVFTAGLGHVVRCRVCGDVLLVVVETPTGTRVFVYGVSGLPLVG